MVSEVTTERALLEEIGSHKGNVNMHPFICNRTAVMSIEYRISLAGFSITCVIKVLLTRSLYQMNHTEYSDPIRVGLC
jgi:hypothetical protein